MTKFTVILCVALAGCGEGVPQSVVDDHMKAADELSKAYAALQQTANEHIEAFEAYKSLTNERLDRLTADSARCAEIRSVGDTISTGWLEFPTPGKPNDSCRWYPIRLPFDGTSSPSVTDYKIRDGEVFQLIWDKWVPRGGWELRPDSIWHCEKIPNSVN